MGCSRHNRSGMLYNLHLIALASWFHGVLAFKVIGAGWPRTGISSLEKSLRHFGFNVYRFGHEVAHSKTEFMKEEKSERYGHKGDLNKWLSIIENPMSHWKESLAPLDELAEELVLRGFDAILDVPMLSIDVALRLIEHFPNAKVILTQHSTAEAWVHSYTMHMSDFDLGSARISPRREVMLDGGKRSLRKLHEAICKKKLELPLVPSEADSPSYIVAYKQYAEDIQTKVPEHRLLTFAPSDGWNPLCNFLGVPVPMGARYPHLNSLRREEAHLRWQQSYNFKFECMFGGLVLYFFGMMGYWMYSKYQAKSKALLEKANV